MKWRFIVSETPCEIEGCENLTSSAFTEGNLAEMHSLCDFHSNVPPIKVTLHYKT